MKAIRLSVRPLAAPDGRVQVRAKLGFESALNDDVTALFLDAVAAR